jgi:hypothetical protein
MLVVSVLMLGAAAPDRRLFFHERKEVAGLAIVFGAEPEPALHDEIQFLRWRVSTLTEEQPYTQITDAQVRITRNGEEFGPYPLRAVRGSPGQYETRHIFTEPGTYESVLSFRKGDEEAVHTVDFGFTINDRAMIEIPGRRPRG